MKKLLKLLITLGVIVAMVPTNLLDAKANEGIVDPEVTIENQEDDSGENNEEAIDEETDSDELNEEEAIAEDVIIDAEDEIESRQISTSKLSEEAQVRKDQFDADGAKYEKYKEEYDESLGYRELTEEEFYLGLMGDEEEFEIPLENNEAMQRAANNWNTQVKNKMNNGYKVPGREKDISPKLPKYNYANGKPEYIVLHEVGNYGGLNSQVNYMKQNWNNAFAHFFLDDKRIIQTADTNYLAWHAAQPANNYSIGIELVRVQPGKNEEFVNSLANYSRLVAELLYEYDMGAPKFMDTNKMKGNIGTHQEIGKQLGGYYTRTDPYSYFKTWNNYTPKQFFDLIKWQYDQIEKENNQPTITYQAHIQKKGWIPQVNEGQTAGTTRESLSLEGFRMNMKNANITGNIEYKSLINKSGWELGWKKNGAVSGTTGKGIYMEALQVQLTGNLAKEYDIYYRVHSAKHGWLGWTKNGAKAGTEGYGLRAEAFQAKLLPKGSKAPGSTEKPFVEKKVTVKPKLMYQAHIQRDGWIKKVNEGATGGTTGKFLRLEGFKIDVSSAGLSGNVEYKSLVNRSGWEKSWKKNGAVSGTERKGIFVEAMQLKLTGELEKEYDVYYRVHSASHGWLGWAKNGEKAGTEGSGLRAEAFQARLVKKGGAAPGTTNKPFIKVERGNASLTYQGHVAKHGWLSWVNEGKVAGTQGKYLRLEAFKLKVSDPDKLGGGVQYRSHVSKYGWQSGWKSNGQVSGTTGKYQRIEAVQIKLTGGLAKKYDIYYRVHSAKYGWLDWAKNGQSAGTSGLFLRAESLQIVLVPKGGSAPGPTTTPYRRK